MTVRALLLVLVVSAGVVAPQAVAVSVPERIPVGRVPSGFPVGFALLTAGGRQHVAYYDAGHQLTVVSRELGAETWTRTQLPSKIGWDSHNYLVMVADDDGHLHLSGNMHCVPLIYFRTTRAGDPTSFERIRSMVGPDEDRCTYPKFMRGPDNELIFHYRIGGSGRGNEIYNVYDHATRTWSRLLDKPLTDGQGKMNAYMHGPVRGPDGFFHLVWVWRDTPDCATNHDLCHARSRDLRSWETLGGEPVDLPLTLDDRRLIVDPVPPGGGIINGCAKIGFNSRQAPIITYHKTGTGGATQAFAAGFIGGKWISRQISDWNYAWKFSGGGSIGFEIHLGTPASTGVGRMALGYSHKTLGRGTLLFDEATLAPLAATDPRRKAPSQAISDPQPRLPSGWEKPRSSFPGMAVRWAEDGGSPEAGVVHRLRWETLPQNRDRPRSGDLPAPSLLELISLPAPAP